MFIKSRPYSNEKRDNGVIVIFLIYSSELFIHFHSSFILDMQMWPTLTILFSMSQD